jgi:nitrite reductase/ring-hydroxylating ferredoxin subunit
MTLVPGWHPVALSGSIDPGTSAGTHIAGREYVVWRDNSGVAHVWEDRCPHRGMKLSFGFVRGDHIACLYHGWQYDTGGRCRYIPAHPDLEVPATITVPVFATVEACGMIWTTTDAEADRAAPPSGSGETVPVATLHATCGTEALLDAVRAVPPAAFVPGTAGLALSPAGETLWRLTVGGDALLLGLQRLGDRRSALHVAIEGSAATYGGAGQAHWYQWIRALRHRLGAAPAAGARPAAAMAEAV